LKKIFTLLLLTLVTQTFGQSGKFYKGTINNNLKITLCLRGVDEGTNDDPIVGAYKYDSKKDYILVNGYRSNDGNIS